MSEQAAKAGAMRAGIIIGALLLAGWAMTAPVKGAPALRGLLFNLDDSDFAFNHRITEGVDGGALVDQYLDRIADAGASVLMCCTNARRTNYASAVWQSYWDGYDPAGPDDQPFLAAVPQEEVASYRRFIHSLYSLHAQGVDYPARVIARCRQRGVSPWISLRMNDVHFNSDLDHPFHGQFWRDPKYHRGGSMPYFARALDYGHPEVRDLYRALIVETLQRYDTDGLELDFMREPYLFREGAEEEGARLLQEWLTGIRGLTQEAAARRGHPVRLGVRVPSRPEVANAWGLRAAEWGRAGLVDLVVVTPRWATIEFNMPIAQWRAALEGTGVTLAGGLEILLLPMAAGPRGTNTPEHAAGAAAAVLAGGADCVYLFNYFPDLGWPRAQYEQTLQAMSSLQELQKLPRRHAITWRDIRAPGEQYAPPLPATGQRLAFELPTGPPPGEGAAVRLELQAKAEAKAPAVHVNDVACKLQDTKANERGVLFIYTMPPAALRAAEPNQISVTADRPVTVEGLEIRIVPPEGQE
jgi:hypothetical protein